MSNKYKAIQLKLPKFIQFELPKLKGIQVELPKVFQLELSKAKVIQFELPKLKSEFKWNCSCILQLPLLVTRLTHCYWNIMSEIVEFATISGFYSFFRPFQPPNFKLLSLCLPKFVKQKSINLHQ